MKPQDELISAYIHKLIGETNDLLRAIDKEVGAGEYKKALYEINYLTANAMNKRDALWGYLDVVEGGDET